MKKILISLIILALAAVPLFAQTKTRKKKSTKKAPRVVTIPVDPSLASPPVNPSRPKTQPVYTNEAPPPLSTNPKLPDPLPAGPCTVKHSELPDTYGARIGMMLEDLKKTYPKMDITDATRDPAKMKQLGIDSFKLGMVGEKDLIARGYGKDALISTFTFVNDRVFGIQGYIDNVPEIRRSREDAARVISRRLNLPYDWKTKTLLRDDSLQMDCKDFVIFGYSVLGSPMYMIMSLDVVNQEMLEELIRRQST